MSLSPEKGNFARNGVRERGVSAIEAIFYLSVAASVIVFTAQLAQNENRRQEDVVTASGLNLFISGAQEYVSSEFGQIRQELLASAQDDGRAEVSKTIQELADLGFIPASFTDQAQNIFGQKYALLMRGVLFQDGATPPATMSESEIDANNDGNIDEALIDRDPSNDEMTIESILVSHDGDPVSANRGPPITVRTEKATAGFVSEPDTARGPYGNFVLDISGFSTFPQYPGPGYFSSIISLARFGAVGLDLPGEPTGDGIDDPLRRCVDILDDPAQSEDGPLYTACLATNQMYSEIVFNSYDLDGDGLPDAFPDLDGDGEPDAFPGITNLMRADMAAPADTDGDGNPDEFSRITGLYDLDMGEGADTDGDGVADRFSRIRNLAAIACENDSGTAVEGNLVVNCPLTEFEGDVNIGGGSTVEGTQKAGRFVSNEMDGQDLSEGVYDARVLRSEETIGKPACPVQSVPDDTGATFAMEPRVYVIPAAYSHPGGLPSVGVRAFAEDISGSQSEDISGSQWRVRLFNFVDEDQCTSSVSNPLTLNTSDFRAENSASCEAGDEDGRADVYEVPGNIGRVLAITRCF